MSKLKYHYCDEFVKSMQRYVDRDFHAKIRKFSGGDVLYIFWRKFILEKQRVDWLKKQIATKEEMWRNYVIPLRRRLEAARQPTEWRTQRTMDKIAVTMS